MAYQQLESIENLDLKSFLQYPTTGFNFFWVLILFAIFMVFTLSTFFKEIRREGRGNILSSLAIAGFVTTAIAVLFSLLDLIQTQIVIIVFVISIIFQIIFLLTSR